MIVHGRLTRPDHLINGTFNASNIPMAPNVTFVRSLLNSAPAVMLPGNAGQVVRLQRLANGSLIVGENRTVVTGNATYMNVRLRLRWMQSER